MLINYSMLNILNVGGLSIKPGAWDYPDVDGARIEQLKKEYPKFARLVDEGTIEFSGSDSDFGSSGSDGQNQGSDATYALKGKKDKDAIRLIEQTGDRDLLVRWKSERNSPNVDKAIAKQIEAIDKAGEPKE